MADDFLRALFTDCATARQKYLEANKIEAFRLYNLEQWELPLAVDIYKKSAVIHIFGFVDQDVLDETEKILREFLKIEDFFYKDRTKSKDGVLRQAQDDSPTSKEMIVSEYGHQFLLNLCDYLDTGLFLDHRETRKWIAGQSKGKVVLNTFAYTGSFSVYAAKAGAAKTYSVDLSRTYCDWIKKNLELNNLPLEQNWIYKMDTLEFLNYAKRKKLAFDIIIIDPPTFSRNKGQTFSVQKDHPALINAALEVLAPKGFILFSNNYKDFVLDYRIQSKCTVHEETKLIPPDFVGVRPHRAFLISC